MLPRPMSSSSVSCFWDKLEIMHSQKIESVILNNLEGGEEHVLLMKNVMDFYIILCRCCHNDKETEYWRFSGTNHSMTSLQRSIQYIIEKYKGTHY